MKMILHVYDPVQKNESLEDIHGFQEDAAKKFVKSLDAINKSLAVFFMEQSGT